MKRTRRVMKEGQGHGPPYTELRSALPLLAVDAPVTGGCGGRKPPTVDSATDRLLMVARARNQLELLLTG